MDWNKLINKGLERVEKTHEMVNLIINKAYRMGAIDRQKGRNARPEWAVGALAEMHGAWIKHWSMKDDVKKAYNQGYGK